MVFSSGYAPNPNLSPYSPYSSSKVRKRCRSLDDVDFSDFSFDDVVVSALKKKYGSSDTEFSNLSPKSRLRLLVFGNSDASPNPGPAAANDDYDSHIIDEYPPNEMEEMERKVEWWQMSRQLIGTGLLDVSDACKLEYPNMKGHSALIELSKECRDKKVLSNFTYPGEPWLDGEMAVYEGPFTALDDLHSLRAAKAINIYNHHSNKPELKFRSVVRVTKLFGPFMTLTAFITLTALDTDTGRIGTYQAAVLVCLATDPPVYLVFLRDVRADKVLAIF